MTMIAILVLLGAVYYFTTPEEKARWLRASLSVIRRWTDLAVHLQPERGPFGDALRERTPWALVTPGLTYSYVFEAFDRAGNKRNIVGPGFTVPAYRIAWK